jgi:LmeA-like phospholipid-binding
MRRITAVLGTAGAVIVLLAIAQLVLPSIAAQQLRDRLQKSGKVLEVKVSAFPAIELLWHHADHVTIRMANYHSNPTHLGSLLNQAGDAGTIDASAAQLDTGLVTLQNATLRKRGDTLTGTATVTEAALRSAVPFVENV